MINRKKKILKFTNMRRKKKEGNVLGCSKGKIKVSIHVPPDCHTTCQDRLLKVSEASRAARRTGKPWHFSAAERTGMSTNPNPWGVGGGSVLHWRAGSSPLEGLYCRLQHPV